MTRFRTVPSPEFSDSLLRRCATAFRHRGKAIRYKTCAFALERALERDGTERLNVDASTPCDRPTQLRVSVWPDGVLWFRAAQPGPSAKGGWAFLLAFHGQMADLTVGDLVALYEESLEHLSGAVQRGAAERLLETWARTHPSTAV